MWPWGRILGLLCSNNYGVYGEGGVGGDSVKFTQTLYIICRVALIVIILSFPLVHALCYIDGHS